MNLSTTYNTPQGTVREQDSVSIKFQTHVFLIRSGPRPLEPKEKDGLLVPPGKAYILFPKDLIITFIITAAGVVPRGGPKSLTVQHP